jgi:hypothetical protein
MIELEAAGMNLKTSPERTEGSICYDVHAGRTYDRDINSSFKLCLDFSQYLLLIIPEFILLN